MANQIFSTVVFYLELLIVTGLCHKLFLHSRLQNREDFQAGKENDKCRVRYFPINIDERVIRYQKKGILNYKGTKDMDNFFWPEIVEPAETRFSKVAHMKYDEFSHLGNPDDLLKSYITNEYTSLDFKISNSKCIRCLPDILKKNSDVLYYPCRDNRVFSPCQKHYLITYSIKEKKYKPYRQTNILSKSTSSDVTLIVHLTLDRQDRIPFILSRWDGPIVIVVALSLMETEDVEDFINLCSSHNNVIIHFYVYENTLYNDCDDNYIINVNNRLIFKDCHTAPFYPINLLRDIGINSIMTTHYTAIDVDLLVSTTMRQNFLKLPRELLLSQKSVFVYPSFEFNTTRMKCKDDSNCENIWKNIPKTKNELLPLFKKKKIDLLSRSYHQIIYTPLWMKSKKDVYKMKCLNSTFMEPYFIKRRSKTLSNYSPYFVNYGFNKMEFFSRLHYEGFTFYVMEQDFGVNTHHEITQFSTAYKQGVKTKGRENKDVMYKMAMKYKELMSERNKDCLPICKNAFIIMCMRILLVVIVLLITGGLLYKDFIKKEVEKNHLIFFKSQYNKDEFSQYSKREYTQWIEKSQFFSNLGDEKELIRYTLQNNNIGAFSIQNSEDMVSFFNSHQNQLLKRCNDFHIFSHCQLFYLFQYDTWNHECHGYSREHYIHENYTGITLVFILSTERMNRLPFQLERWNGNMSITILLEKHELPYIASIVSTINHPSIRFTFYILEDSSTKKYHCSVVLPQFERQYYHYCFPYNVLRDLAIESIQTSHYLLIDSDAILSTTFHTHIQDFTSLLANEKEVILIPLFPLMSPYRKYCFETGNCTQAWSKIPSTKEELIKSFKEPKLIKSRHRIVNYNEWKIIQENKVIEMQEVRLMEPYGVFKRTPQTPLYHPYFVNYGKDKEDFYRVLNTMGYHYNVMTMDFLVDLPHPRSHYGIMMYDGSVQNARKHIDYVELMYNTYCKNHICNYFRNSGFTEVDDN